MKIFLTLFVIMAFVGCQDQDNIDKINELEKSNKKLTEYIENDLNTIKSQFDTLQHNDKYLFAKASRLLDDKDYKSSLKGFYLIVDSYPHSIYVIDSQERIERIEKLEEQNYDKTIELLDKESLTTKIKILNDYLQGQPSENYEVLVAKMIEGFNTQLKNEKGKEDALQKTGLQIVSTESRWVRRSELFVPELRIKFKNVSGHPIKDSKEIKVTFLNLGKKEIWDNQSYYLHSSFDPPISHGYIKEAFIYSGVGFTYDIQTDRLPNLLAEIYIEVESKDPSGYTQRENILIHKVKISRKYW